MVTVISQITLRVGGKKIPAGTPVEISEADAENLSEYITIVSEASVSDENIQYEDIQNEDIQNEDIQNEDIQNEDIQNEDIQSVSESEAVNTAPRGRGRPPITQK